MSMDFARDEDADDGKWECYLCERAIYGRPIWRLIQSEQRPVHRNCWEEYYAELYDDDYEPDESYEAYS